MTESKIRIAHLITDLDVGGAEKNLVMLAMGLDRERFEVSVASLMPPGAYGVELRAAGIPVCDVHMTGRTDLRGVGRVAAWVRRESPDILHTWLFHANFMGRLTALCAGRPVVVSSIQVAEPRRSHLLLERLTAPLADCILTICPSLHDYVVGRGIRAKRMRSIAHGIDLDDYPKKKRSRRTSAAAVVLFVGRLTEQKGVDVLLRAASKLSARGDLRFDLIGDGPDRNDLEKLASYLQLTNVRFLGRSECVPELMCEADLFVLPSRWEGMGNVLLEAMAARCPVIGTNIVGIRDVVRDEVNGLLVPPEDPDALASAIERMVSQPALAASLAEEGYETARKHSVAAMVEAHEKLYLELLAAHPDR